jgi:hypothetical protein
MSKLTWEDVLKREDLIGGDIESQEGGAVYRGPLSKIRREGDHIYFESPWCAKNYGEGWKNWHITSCSVNAAATTPQDIGDGRVFFQMPYLGVCTIFPKGGSKLDPAKVEGLDVEANA